MYFYAQMPNHLNSYLNLLRDLTILIAQTVFFMNVGWFQVADAELVKSDKFPVVVSTWPFLEAVRAAWRAVDNGSSAVEAVVEGCSACEELRCDGTGRLFGPII
jgi:N4-(beta-N-acetylglucosaminyl)-L-asparaginase